MLKSATSYSTASSKDSHSRHESATSATAKKKKKRSSKRSLPPELPPLILACLQLRTLYQNYLRSKPSRKLASRNNFKRKAKVLLKKMIDMEVPETFWQTLTEPYRETYEKTYFKMGQMDLPDTNVRQHAFAACIHQYARNFKIRLWLS